MWNALLIFLCVCVVSRVVAQNETAESRLVQTAQGPVRGYKYSGGGLYAFYNIPYATAPTGIHKFKAPLPPPTWDEPFEAIDKRIICPQRASSPNSVMEEDCLIANVFVPDTQEQNLPVMVNFHGGGFRVGFGATDTLKILVATKNIIVVNFNYRLGIHGFLCLHTEDAPGNAGMKDQVALLRWVKENIASFGGNPDEVTISGCSAGSVSVDLLMLSPTTEGLFNKVIACSGANVGPFGVIQDPIGNAKNYAKIINFTNVDDVNALEEFYKTAPIDLLLVDFTNNENSALHFSPCLELDTGVEIFLDEAPVDIIKKGQYKRLPMLYGFTHMEGLMRSRNFDDWKDRMNESFSDFLPAGLQFDSENHKEEVANTIKQFYFGDQPVSENSILTYIDYFTDVLIAYPMLWSVKLQVEAGNDQVYLHEYSFVDDNTPFVSYTNVRGAGHCAQNIAVLDHNNLDGLYEFSITEELKSMKVIMRELWSNFIKTGKPVPEGSNLPAWPAVALEQVRLMSLGLNVELTSLQGTPLERRARFWDDIYQRFYRNPVPPAVTDGAISHTIANTWFTFVLLIAYHFL